jgi:hypothetical protein
MGALIGRLEFGCETTLEVIFGFYLLGDEIPFGV